MAKDKAQLMANALGNAMGKKSPGEAAKALSVESPAEEVGDHELEPHERQALRKQLLANNEPTALSTGLSVEGGDDWKKNSPEVEANEMGMQGRMTQAQRKSATEKSVQKNTGGKGK